MCMIKPCFVSRGAELCHLRGADRVACSGDHELEAPKQSDAADLADERARRAEGRELALETASELGGAIHQPLVLVRRDRGHDCSAGEGMRVRGQPAEEGVVVEVPRDPLVHDHGAPRGVPGRQPLGAGDHVRDDALVIDREPSPGPPEA